VVRAFTLALADAFERRAIPPNLKTEGAFERDFAVPVAIRILKRYPAVSLFIHPWGNKSAATPLVPRQAVPSTRSCRLTEDSSRGGMQSRMCGSSFEGSDKR
jgi:hypothetical protein